MAQTDENRGLHEEDVLRARFYGLLARLLVAAPTASVLSSIASIEGDDETPMGRALHALAVAARNTSAEAAELEFQKLFIGTATEQPEVMPYASYYLAGFRHDRPLTRLREDMEKLGITRAEAIREPEDHIAALCEVMHALIVGSFGEPAALATQRRFFDDHIAPWGPRLFRDLEAAPSAALYMPVGAIGSVFLDVETQAFQMLD